MALDASDETAVEELLRAKRCDVLVNAVDPRFVMPLFNGALHAGVTYLDMAMSLSHPHPERPYAETGVKLGDEQFALAAAWEARGQLALVGMGVEPGLSDVFARYAADNLFSQIDEIGVRDGANLVVDGYDFAPTFSIWTTIEECLNPPVIWERDQGWFTTEPFSELEVFEFPAGIGPVECVNVEHEEVLLVPRWVDAQRVTFKYGLGEEFIGVLKTLHKLGLDSTTPVKVGEVEVSPRDVVAACLPDPAELGDRMHGVTCAGHLGDRHRHSTADPARSTCTTPSTTPGRWRNTARRPWCGRPRSTPSWRSSSWPAGAWSGAGVLGPEAFPAEPFLDLLGRARRTRGRSTNGRRGRR